MLETLGGLARARPSAPAVVATSAELAPTRGRRRRGASTVEPAAGALWGYLAVRGGIDVQPVLGSRSHGLALRARAARAARSASTAADRRRSRARRSSSTRRRRGAPTATGRRLARPARSTGSPPDALERLAAAPWTVSADVSRVGVRLDGPPLRAARSTDELPSEGLLTGAVQVPPDGRPVVMLADHPTTGGYPVLAVVDPAVARRRRPGAGPGTAVRFRRPTLTRRAESPTWGYDMADRLRFGIFMAPFHQAGENPTLALERDLELVAHLDRLGWDEAWIGEHHSAGTEIIASPEIFIAAAAERTRHIKLGTGVISVAYHNPYMVAERAVLLDHLTRGRFMLGVGPGLAADRRHHARPRPDRDPAAARGGPRRDHAAADAPRSR